MTEQTDAAEVALSDIVEDLTDLPLSWDFFPEPDAALDDVARLIRAREAAAEARGAAEERAALEPLIEQARVTIAAAEARGAERALREAADDVHREARYLYGLHPDRRPDIQDRLAIMERVFNDRADMTAHAAQVAPSRVPGGES